MRRVLWALLVLLGAVVHPACRLPLWAAAAAQPSHHPTNTPPNAGASSMQDWLHNLGDYEVVVPVRQDGSGTPRSSHHPHYLRKRSVNDNDNTDKEEDSANTDTLRRRYSIVAFGRTLELEVEVDKDITPPHVIFEEVDAEGANVTMRPRSQFNGHCMHRGRVIGDDRSDVAVSLCHNMMGSIRAFNQHYLIEPHPNISLDTDVEAQKPHIIYKVKDIFSSHGNVSTKSCGFDDNYKHSRWKDPTISDSPTISSSYSSSSDHLNGSSSSSRRHRRSALNSWRRNVEVMVVADHKMLDFHGADLHDYLFVLFSIVASIYRHPSIGNYINIVVVKVHVLKDDQAGPVISANAASTLTSFCRYQRKINNLDDTSPDHHDTAVLVTRHDLCRSQNECDTLGLAELGTMCDVHRSCSIVEDNGLSTAFTIAHELGHVFNLKHDDEIECLQEFPELKKESNYKVMAPTLDHRVDVYAWSECSKKVMTEFLNDGFGDCLLDDPVQNMYAAKLARLKDTEPGAVYNVNQQCEQAFGKGYKICPFLAQCERLFCQNSWSNNAQCYTQHMRWAEGTRCSTQHPNMVCQRGQCVNPRTKPKVDGGWSTWSHWGSCSRTCGGGVKSGQRSCSQPAPRNGGEFCVGKRVRYRSCNTKDCPPGTKDFREQQCAKYDGYHFNINGIPPDVKWVPKYDGVSDRDRCKLFCKAEGKNRAATFLPPPVKVIDGTKCGPYTSDLCVNGQCHQAGCDNHLGSKMKRDKCGKCGGDNTSCKFVQQSYNHVTFGYHGNFTIPAGALNIDIRQQSYTDTSADDTYLALKVPNSQPERWILNGIVEQIKDGVLHRHKMVTPFRKTFMVNNTLVEYSGSNSIEERINITMKINSPLQLLVLSVGELYPPGLKWSYLISKPTTGFHWSTKGPWTSCTHVCQGTRTRRVICESIDSKQRVSDRHCMEDPELIKPSETTRQCNTHCQLQWQVIEGECSAACGTGIMVRKVKCMKNIRRGQRFKYIPEKFCMTEVGAAPPVRVPCRGKCLHTHWEYTDWSKCTRSCGGGVQYRHAKCLDMNNQQVDSKQCNEANNYVVRKCNEETCPVWETAEWTGCSVTCGEGWRYRQVSCKQDKTTVSKTLCPPDEEPETKTVCSKPACPVWHVGTWGQCSTTCGKGVKRRAVKCRLDSGMILKDEECDIASRPNSDTSCYESQCPTTTEVVVQTVAPTTEMQVPEQIMHTEWRTGSWTQCSASCGKGSRQRYVSCRDHEGAIADDSACDQSTRPPEQEQCKLRACGQWRTGEWTQCSVTCGEGLETRLVACVTLGELEEQRATPEYCDVSVQPAAERMCNQQVCVTTADYDITSITSNSVVRTAHWRVGRWSSCSSTCEGGWQQRAVVCQDETGNSDQCDLSQKPPHITACNAGDCPRWNYGGWGHCSATCGSGSRQRVIRCQLPNGQILPDASCDLMSRPRSSEMCKADVACEESSSTSSSPKEGNTIKPGKDNRSIMKQYYPYWYKGPWSAWYNRNRNRYSILRAHRAGNISIINADDFDKNNSTACSVDCGRGGIRTRVIACRDSSGKRLADSECKDRRKKPPTSRRCRKSKCARWWTGKWGKCSSTCGIGIRKRQVKCARNKGKSVDPSLCANLTAPRDTEFCEHLPCGDYHWKASDWSECSASCGPGRMKRKVECVSQLHNVAVNKSLCSDMDRPKRKRLCFQNACPYVWVEGQWSECSEACGVGVQHRNLTCQAVSQEGWVLPGEVEGCSLEDKPEVSKACNRGDCNALYHWIAGPWSLCSGSCGEGRSERQVQCVSADGQPHDDAMCVRRYRPTHTHTCYKTPCYASSCRELKAHTNSKIDGEYRLNVQGKLLQIYCHRMKRKRPREYLSLPAGDKENYSEIYKHRLANPHQCPSNGTRMSADSLPPTLRSSDYRRAGLTSFSKVRLNITSLQIIAKDFTFSRTSKASKRVPFATAGDCYSSLNCPQGEFHVNLIGTGFKLAPIVEWSSSGRKSSQNIRIDEDQQRVHGQCGGHCSQCSPNVLQLIPSR